MENCTADNQDSFADRRPSREVRISIPLRVWKKNNKGMRNVFIERPVRRLIVSGAKMRLFFFHAQHQRGSILCTLLHNRPLMRRRNIRHTQLAIVVAVCTSNSGEPVRHVGASDIAFGEKLLFPACARARVSLMTRERATRVRETRDRCVCTYRHQFEI